MTWLWLLLPLCEGKNRLEEGRFDFLKQVFLVLFDRQYVITAFFHNPVSDCFLAKHCIPGDNQAL